MTFQAGSPVASGGKAAWRRELGVRPQGLGGRKALWEPRGLSLPSNSLSLRPWNFSGDPPRRRGQPVRRKQAKAVSAQLLRGEAASELAGRARRLGREPGGALFAELLPVP